jgi:hypothetical protein
LKSLFNFRFSSHTWITISSIGSAPEISVPLFVAVGRIDGAPTPFDCLVFAKLVVLEDFYPVEESLLLSADITSSAFELKS